MLHRPLLVCLVALALVPACANGRPRDTTPRPDAGPGVDGGPRVDAGPPHDAGPDAGERDVGPGTDTGTPELDAGTPDSGAADVGTPSMDAGPGTDAAMPGTDAAMPGTDAATPDAGLRDAGHDAYVNRCAGVDCSAMTSGCLVGRCDPATGACGTMWAVDGTGCSDGNACTTGDHCFSGSCVAGTGTLDCSALTAGCATGTCNPATGCTTTPAADGTSCGAPTGCSAQVCMAGACTRSPLADCGACGGGSFCAAGTCGANPTTLTYDFETGRLPTGWTTSGSPAWSVISGGAHGGTYRARSGAISDGGTTSLSFSINLASDAQISFWLQTSSESGFDFLRFFVDGVQQGQWSGTTAWTPVTFALATGTHTLEWRYTKDGSVSSGSDTVWIDDVAIVSGGTSPATGFESTSLPTGYTTSGSANWTTTTTSPHAGARCAASGVITDSQSTSMFRTVTLPSASTLTFWYRVSSESGYDYLSAWLDGTMLGQWSGTVAWTMSSFPIGAGTHTVEWRYAKDISLASGSDQAWIDDVDFGYTPVAGPLCR
jgi:hypothetical protein